MKYNKNCCLCKIESGIQRFGDIDKPFMESQNYFAIASIGAFIEGWTMIIPRSHKLSCASDFNSSEFLDFAVEVKKHVESEYGNVVIFEHGASIEGSPIGCGVDHAHLHIVPSRKDIEHEIRTTDFNWKEYDSEITENLYDSIDYLFYVKMISKTKISGLIATPEFSPSQFFRQILAQSVGLEDVADYKSHFHFKSSTQTHSRLSR